MSRRRRYRDPIYGQIRDEVDAEHRAAELAEKRRRAEACVHCAAGEPLKSRVGAYEYHVVGVAVTPVGGVAVPSGFTYAACTAGHAPGSLA